MSNSTQDDNVVTRMFAWWNETYRKDGFTPDGFAQFFTADAPFVVNGGVRGEGPEAICAHFQRIKAKTETVELVTPVKAVLANDTLAFVRYDTAARVDGKDWAERCLAVAQLRDGRIAAFEVIGADD